MIWGLILFIAMALICRVTTVQENAGRAAAAQCQRLSGGTLPWQQHAAAAKGVERPDPPTLSRRPVGRGARFADGAF